MKGETVALLPSLLPRGDSFLFRLFAHSLVLCIWTLSSSSSSLERREREREKGGGGVENLFPPPVRGLRLGRFCRARAKHVFCQFLLFPV